GGPDVHRPLDGAALARRPRPRHAAGRRARVRDRRGRSARREPADPLSAPAVRGAYAGQIMDPTIKDFESALGELEEIVKKMEDGDLTLERSMELYERGLQLSRFCHSTLEAAERRVEILNDRGETRPAPASLGQATDDEIEQRR